MTDKTTRVVTESIAKGFKETARQARETQDALKPSKETVRAISDTEKTVTEIGKAYEKLGRQARDASGKFIAGGREGATAVREWRREMEGAGHELDRLIQKKDRLSFSKGVAQGLGIGEYFPEQTRAGFHRNLAGRAVGRGLSGGISLAGTPFTGASGITTALSGIPLVGGVMAGALQSGLGYAEQALGILQARTAMAQFSGGAFAPGIAAARARAAAGVSVPGLNRAAITRAGTEASAAVMGERDLESNYARNASRAIAAKRLGIAPEDVRYGAGQASWELLAEENRVRQQMGGRLRMQAGIRADAAGKAAEAAEQQRQEKGIRAAQQKRDAAADRAEARARAAPFDFIRRQGVRYGLDEAGALGAAGEFLGASGTDLSGLRGRGRDSGMFTAALRARGRYGVSMATSGAFLRAAENGGVEGSPASALTTAIQNALRMGLKGSDVERHVAQVAQQMNRWTQTGIPVVDNARHSNALAGVLGTDRADALSMSAINKAQGISMAGGPASAAEVLMMRRMGGWTGTGGVKEMFQSQLNLERGGDPNGLMQMFRDVSNTGTDEGDAMAIQNLARNLNMSMGLEEALNLKQGKMSPEFLKRLQQGGATAGTVEGELGRFQVSGAEQRRAAQTNANTGTGMGLLKPMQDLEEISARMAKNAATFGKEIGALTGWANGASKKVSELITKFESVLDRALHAAGQGG